MKLDIEFVRAQFPAFEEPSLKGQAFFENAGGSYTCKPVVDRLTRYYRERKVQPYASYDASRVAGEEMDEARLRLAAMLNVQTHELSFGPSTTQNVYVLAQAFREYMNGQGTVIVTNQDHEANSGAWRRLADTGVTIRDWQIDPETGHLDLDDLKNLLDDTVKLVVFPHCSNVVAEINDVAAISAIAHEAGAYVCVDGVSYAPHGFPDVDALGADIYMFSAYKTYGPHQGIMVVREGIGMTLPNQAHSFNANTLYKRFTPAGPDHAQVAACAGMADYVDQLYAHHFHDQVTPAARAVAVHDMMRDHETQLMEPLIDFISAKNTVQLLGPKDAAGRAPTMAMVTQNNPADIGRALAPHGIMADGGDFYAVRPLTALGIDPARGVLRTSFVHYTSQEEVERLIHALDHVL